MSDGPEREHEFDFHIHQQHQSQNTVDDVLQTFNSGDLGGLLLFAWVLETELRISALRILCSPSLCSQRAEGALLAIPIRSGSSAMSLGLLVLELSLGLFWGSRGTSCLGGPRDRSSSRGPGLGDPRTVYPGGRPGTPTICGLHYDTLNADARVPGLQGCRCKQRHPGRWTLAMARPGSSQHRASQLSFYVRQAWAVTVLGCQIQKSKNQHHVVPIKAPARSPEVFSQLCGRSRHMKSS